MSDDGEQEVVAVGSGSGQRRGRPNDRLHRYTSVVQLLWGLPGVSTRNFLLHFKEFEDPTQRVLSLPVFFAFKMVSVVLFNVQLR